MEAAITRQYFCDLRQGIPVTRIADQFEQFLSAVTEDWLDESVELSLHAFPSKRIAGIADRDRGFCGDL